MVGLDGSEYAYPMGDGLSAREPMGEGLRADVGRLSGVCCRRVRRAEGFAPWRGRYVRHALAPHHPSRTSSPTVTRGALTIGEGVGGICPIESRSGDALASGEGVGGTAAQQCGFRDSQTGHALMGRPS